MLLIGWASRIYLNLKQMIFNSQKADYVVYMIVLKLISLLFQAECSLFNLFVIVSVTAPSPSIVEAISTNNLGKGGIGR